ncbi:MAG: leucine--tRNA ligase [Coriobacteriales bacterium]|jgi:leucyl-tRNA synthetase
MPQGYNPQEIEPKWQKIWADEKLFKLDPASKRPAKYVLEMFPYPSGDIHMGHVRNYTIGDVYARYLHMKGCDVLHPIGWDAFGLPAENAAIKHKSHPAKWTFGNIDTQCASFKRMGLSYDWDCTVITCKEDYYRWGQWFFLKMYEKGLAYRKSNPVNWCPSCKTVLANEQVEQGLCWRCHSVVERKELDQWYLKITDYAEELLDDLDKLPGWPERVKQMQANWIGRSEGAHVDFTLCDEAGEPTDTKITVFTTRPDTLFGCTFFLLAPEHPMVNELISGTEYEQACREVIAIAEKATAVERTMGDREKHGAFTGRYVVNPVNNEKVPVWIADYVLTDYGTGAVMAVPSGDQRDFEFAKKYGLSIPPVVVPEDDALFERLKDEKTRVVDNVDWPEAYDGPGTMVQSGEFTGMQGGKDSEGAKAVISWLEKKGCGEGTVNFRLRDWLISRQRYWGNPIPMIYCDKCGIVPVPEEDLPVVLPQDVDIAAGETLKDNKDFYECTCPKCGGPAHRETDTMDTFTCSSWYFMRYTDPHNSTAPFDSDKVNRFMPVDQYIGGIEHAILHLLYARFWTKVARDLGMVDFDEPFTNLLCQGMVKDEHGETMSKSKGNVVSPEDVIAKYGVDAARAYILFMAPPDKDLQWDDRGCAAMEKFLRRVWGQVWTLSDEGGTGAGGDKAAENLNRKLHQTIKKVTEDIERFNFNTALAAIMELANATADYLKLDASKRDSALCKQVAETLVLLLAPYAPHWADELWTAALGHEKSAYCEDWPQYDEAQAAEDEVERAVMIGGKVRAHIITAADAPEDEIVEAALAAVADRLEGKTVRKTIVAPTVVNVVAN